LRLLDKNAEHGTSEVFVWSGVRIGGVPLKQVASARGVSLEKQKLSGPSTLLPRHDRGR